MQGQSDLELNDIGKNQAINVRNKIEGKNIDIILVCCCNNKLKWALLKE